ncbi:hypothetical protein [Shewanella sp. NIFS-20-20]|uniref:hypothetical protein n=1 Tax=Shewanella sp. NIFS-20-20 TaxID=2853806 RepID=UPI001C44737F|nr:hypothetical protein [Shewanella sp. NIFS-20-20]MBV7314082.1 hypothetical protein [Shewanella sp. NIFS-20-20]
MKWQSWSYMYAALWLASGSTAWASDDIDKQLAVFATAQSLSDIELGQQRGRYIVSGQAYYFGLLMQTHYLDHHGVTQQASMQLEINPQGLTVTVAESQLVMGEYVEANLYGQASGLQQRIQIAGEDNHVINDFSLGSGQLAPLVGGQQVSLGQVLVSEDGQRQYSAVPGHFGIQLQLNNGQSQQMLLNHDGGRQLLQSTTVNGSHHQIINSSQLQFGGVHFGRLGTSILAQQLLGNNFYGQ